MNIGYGILNWKRNIMKILPSIPQESKVILCTSHDFGIDALERNFSEKVILVKADENIPKSKNLIISKAIELGFDYLVLMEDDVIIKDASVVSKFIDKMKEFNLGVMFYGYHSRNNVAFGNPIPCLEISYSKEDKEVFVRLPCTAFFVIDLSKNKELFREDLRTIYVDEYLQRCKDKKFIPFNGFFFDIPESWKYFERTDDPTLLVLSQNDVELDKAVMARDKIELKIDSNFAEVKTFLFNHILEKEGLLKKEETDDKKHAI